MNKNTLLSFICLFVSCKDKSSNQDVQVDTQGIKTALTLKDELSEKPQGFILKDAECAGLHFVSPNLVLWTNETDCLHPDTFNLKWIDDSTFMAKDIRPLNEDCPPKVFLYKLVSFDGRRLILKDIWTGWNNLKDETLEFIKDESPEK